MPSLDSLPGDQRAVLQLVLSRGRSYAEIARLLSINPSAVRERAVRALDALGPMTGISAESQGLIADYLLGQLPEDQVQTARDLLADSPTERAWARVVSSELAPLASGSLPEIPLERSAEPVAAPVPVAAPAPEPALDPPSSTPLPEPSPPAPATAESPPEAAEPPPKRRREKTPKSSGPRRTSRLGGMIVIVVAVAVVAVVLIIALGSGASKKTPASTPTTTSTPAASASSSTTATSSTSTSAKVLAQVNLSPPATATGSKAAGIAEVLSEGTSDGIAIVAENIPPNTTKPPNAYAVWLYNSPTDAHILGFVNPGVGKTGRLSTAGALPTNASHYKDLIVTLETTAQPKTPGTIVLEGALTGL